MIVPKRIIHGIYSNSFWKKGLLIAFSFLLVSLAQEDWSVLACVLTSFGGYALFWWGVSHLRKKVKFILALSWMTGIQLLQQGWLASSFYTGPFIFLGLSLHAISYGLAFGALTLFVKRDMKLMAILAVTATWTLLEWARPWLFFGLGFSWNPTGLPLTATMSSLHFASVFGIAGLTFWVMLANLCLYRYKARGFVVGCLPFLLGGALFLKHKSVFEDHGTVNLLLVQQAKSPFMPEPLIWKNLCALLEDHLTKPYDYIVLSEGGLPHAAQVPYIPGDIAKFMLSKHWGKQWNQPRDQDLVTNHEMMEVITDIAQTPMIVGMGDDRGEEGFYNAAFYFHPKSETASYHKRHLLPFGEYLPFCFRWSRPFLPIDPGFSRGNSPLVFGDEIPFGLSICYEETVGSLNRKTRKEGALFLMGLTNDVWYPKSRLPITHLNHAKVRTVELGMPMIRACNTGVTCSIDHLGRVMASLPYETKRGEALAGLLDVKLPVCNYRTAYLFWGDWPVLMSCFSFILISCIVGNRKMH